MSMKFIFSTILLSAFFVSSLWAQKEYKVATIGFWNFENLFDTIDTPNKRDSEFTPKGRNLWTGALYKEKLDHLAQVVSEVAVDVTPDGNAILGVAEIENRDVLEDFVRHPLIKNRNYQIVHYESPDRRGIDVALLYQPKYFKVTESKALPLMIYKDNGERIYTRDVLFVSGYFDGEPLHIFVNHWPSRSGGEKASMPFRCAGADLVKSVVDSLVAADPNAKIVIMGDLNDDPVSASVKKHLMAEGNKGKVSEGELYNPMLDYYRKGYGTLAYRDAWNLFDQVIVSYGLINGDNSGYQFYKTSIFNKDYMLQKSGQFQGYPFRTFGGGNYLGGYSDHFPVYLTIIKER